MEQLLWGLGLLLAGALAVAAYDRFCMAMHKRDMRYPGEEIGDG